MQKLVVVALFSILLAGCDDVERIDNGFAASSGVELRPGQLPHVVTWSEDVEALVFPDAMEWVAAQLGMEAFVLPGEDTLPATIVGSGGFVPEGTDGYVPGYAEGVEAPVVWTRLHVDDETSAVDEGYILLNASVSLDQETATLVVARALLMTLGLAYDSPGIGSILSDPLDEAGVVTLDDLERLDPYLQF